MGSLDEAYIDITDYLQTRQQSSLLNAFNNRFTPEKFIRKRYGGQCICRLPLIPSTENTDSLTKIAESCLKCKQERITYEDEVEFGITRAEVVREIRFRVEQATGLTCSAGMN